MRAFKFELNCKTMHFFTIRTVDGDCKHLGKDVCKHSSLLDYKKWDICIIKLISNQKNLVRIQSAISGAVQN